MIDDLPAIISIILVNLAYNISEFQDWVVVSISLNILGFIRFTKKMKLMFKEIKEINQLIGMAYEDGTPMRYENGNIMAYEKDDISKIDHLKKIYSIISKWNL